MAGKWSKFRGKLPAFSLDAFYQEKVDAWKQTFLGTKDTAGANVAMLAKELAGRKLRKDTLEDKLYALNLELEALSQLVVDALTGEAQEKVQLTSGATVYLRDSVHPSVEDKAKLMAWIKQTHQESLLSLNAQTLKGMVGERFLQGQPLMPGVKAFLKTQATVLWPGKQDED
jgi:hypothetical protein